MNWMLPFESQPVSNKVSYDKPMLFIGSCFSNNLGIQLQEAKFQVSYNPMGVVFDPLSIIYHLKMALNNQAVKEDTLFEHNELWHSWHHHSVLSSTSKQQTICAIEAASLHIHKTLKQASHLFITMGTAFSYVLKESHIHVANCHKTPKQWFDKKLLSIEEMKTEMVKLCEAIKLINRDIEIVFTVSPVKHIRDGVVENSRSKARLLETAHAVVDMLSYCSYFPAYEMVTDVLRDYRFYASDMAHPNEQAVNYVLQQFCQTYMSVETQQMKNEIKQVVAAKKHQVLHAGTLAHQQFLNTFLAKTELLKVKLPFVNWEDELAYFRVLKV